MNVTAEMEVDEKKDDPLPVFELHGGTMQNRLKDVFGCLDELEVKHKAFEKTRASEDADLDKHLIREGPKVEELETVKPKFKRPGSFSGQDYQSSSRGDSNAGPGQHTEFKKPMPPSRGYSRGQRGRFGRGRTPDYKVHPENWTEYSLEDVDVSDASNKQAAFSFLQERRSLNETDAKESAADLESKACSKGQIVFKRPSKTKTADNQDKAKDRQTKVLSVDVDNQSDEEEGKDCDLKLEDTKEKSQAHDAELNVDRHSLKRKLDELGDIGDKTADIGSSEKQVEFKSRKTSKRQIRSRQDKDDDSD